jgi:hypothetical protein
MQRYQINVFAWLIAVLQKNLMSRVLQYSAILAQLSAIRINGE